MRHLVHLAGKADTAQLRTAVFQGVEHLVVPVVALVEGVVQPFNAVVPELVLASELAVAPQGWNGRPVLPNHPTAEDQPVGANSPETLETQQFGTLFNTHFEGGKLLTEAWLSEAKATTVGKDALSVLARCRAGETVEVSVGAFVTMEESAGEHEGQPYQRVWRDIVPDHLAMLPVGTRGACSVKMGCGAPRVAQEHAMSDEKKSLRERILSLMTFRRAAGMESELSDQDLRNAIDAALRAVEPAYLGIDAVFPADGAVVYAVSPENEVEMYRRAYSVSEGTVTLKESRERVHLVATYEPVVASAATDAGCDCGSAEGDAEMAEKKDRIKALIDCPKTPFAAGFEAALEALSDEQLTALEAHYAEPEPEPKVEEPKVEEPKPLTEEQFLAAAPESIRQLVSRQRAADTTKKDSLLAALKGKQDAYSETELSSMSIESLEKLARVAKVTEVDFSGRAAPRQLESDAVPAPPSLIERLGAKK